LSVVSTPPERNNAAMSEPAVNQLISVQRAIEILDQTLVHPRKVAVPLAEAAGMRLAADVTADGDYPPFNKALLDGFALRAADAAQPGAVLSVIDTIPAGVVGQTAVGPGQAAAIMTGAPMPAGADAVVAVEQTARDGDRVALRSAVRIGDAVARRGSDCAAGRVVLPTGARLTPAAIAVAASVGVARPLVFARPSVAVLSTGDELVEIDRQPTGAQIRNSNSCMLVALLQSLGCEVRNLGSVPDDPDQIRAAMADGLTTQALFVTGGMSMGERDYVPQLMRTLQLDLKITKLRIKPGKPFVLATSSMPGNPFAFGLPGNPVSAFVCTLRLANRILTRLAGGIPDPILPTAPLLDSLPPGGPREFYQPAILSGGGVRPLRWKGSADIFTLARADVLIVRPEHAPPASVGDMLPVLHLPK
jgi:molybdopterin molybdotransferase